MKNPIQSIDRRNRTLWANRNKLGKKAIEIAKENLQLSRKNNYVNGEAESLTYFTILSYWYTKPCNYLKNLYKALDLISGIDKPLLLSRICNCLAIINDHYGDYEKAREFGNKSMLFAKQVNAKPELADALTTIGQLQMRVEDFQTALSSFNKALKIRGEIGDKSAISSSYNLIARNYTLQHDYNRARLNYTKALQIRLEIGDKIGLPWTYLGLATVAVEKTSFSEAISLFKKGLNYNEPIGNKRYELVCKMGIAEAFFREDNIDEAKIEIDSVLKTAKRLKLKPVEMEIYALLAEIEERQEDYKASHANLKKHFQLKEQLFNAEVGNRIRNQQIKFSVEKARRKSEIHRLKNVELKNALDAIEVKNEEILDSIRYAKRIQTAILPEQDTIREHLKSAFVIYLPKDIVSGDFYWLRKKQDRVYLALADCTGHGVPGAFVSIFGKIGLDKVLNEKRSSCPSRLLYRLNQVLSESLGASQSKITDGMDISLLRIDMHNKVVEFAGARGILYLARGKNLKVYNGDRHSLENSEDKPEFTKHCIACEKGDRIFTFTDGIVDQFGGPENKKFLKKRMKELLIASNHLPLAKQKQHIYKTIETWRGKAEQTDDITLIGIEF